MAAEATPLTALTIVPVIPVMVVQTSCQMFLTVVTMAFQAWSG